MSRTQTHRNSMPPASPTSPTSVSADGLEMTVDWTALDSEHIAKTLSSYRPVTSNKNIWAYWNTGWETMKPWCKRNVMGWVRKLGPDWTVRILDKVEGSENHVYRYLDKANFPPAFNDGTMTGPYVGAHSADLIRLPCLVEYGGIWLDVSIMLLRHVDEICWTALTEPTSRYSVGGFVLPEVHKEHQIPMAYMENWFIASPKPQNPFIKRWHAVFMHYWSDINESKGAKTHPLFAHLDTGGYRQDMIDYLAQHLSFQRVRTLVDAKNDWHGPDFYHEQMYLLDARPHAYHLPQACKWNGPKCFDMLKRQRTPTGSPNSSTRSSRRSSAIPSTATSPSVSHIDLTKLSRQLSSIEQEQDEEQAEQAEAEQVVEHIVQESCLTKSVHGFKGNTQLSDLWNKEENREADIERGTFAEYLRQASEFGHGQRPVRERTALRPLTVDRAHAEREFCLHAELLQPHTEVMGAE